MTVLRVRPNADTIPLRRLLIAVLTIATLLGGLIAMHSMVMSDGSAAAAAHLNSHSVDGTPAWMGAVDRHAEEVASTSKSSSLIAQAQSCGGACEMNCLLVGMVCALTMLAAIVGLLLVKWPAPPRLTIAAVVRIVRVVAQHIPAPVPPSLHMLSISRV